MSDIVKSLNTKADMIMMGEKITWGSDSAIMREAADEIEKLRAALKPFAEPSIWDGAFPDDMVADTYTFGQKRAAIEALNNGGKDDR